MNKNILILGAAGQIGSELTQLLRDTYPNKTVVASDIHHSEVLGTPFELLDATDEKEIRRVVEKYEIGEVYLMAAMLSATAEKYPEKAWQLNMQSLLIVLNLAKEKRISKIFWPSSIAVFGPNTPKTQTPQHTILEPSTVYGISKLAGEQWCAYYANTFGVDVRSLRYPGLISWKTPPGGGTTDYAIDIFHHALASKKYHCFLSENTTLPMMYIDDALRATVQIMEAEREKLQVKTSYNLSGVSFSPQQIVDEIRKHFPNFKIAYEPDFRQRIADSWPQSIDDSYAQKDWNWKAAFDIKHMVSAMIHGLKSLEH
jgi:nucleoside-diphosphate-sugar epimerase